MRNTKKTVEKHDLHVKLGDTVILTSGKNKGEKGIVKKVITSENKVVVEGVNKVKKAQRPNPMAGIQGGLVEIEAAVDSSKVMVFCQSCEKATRIEHAIVDGKKVRVCKKCKKEIK